MIQPINEDALRSELESKEHQARTAIVPPPVASVPIPPSEQLPVVDESTKKKHRFIRPPVIVAILLVVITLYAAGSYFTSGRIVVGSFVLIDFSTLNPTKAQSSLESGSITFNYPGNNWTLSKSKYAITLTNNDNPTSAIRIYENRFATFGDEEFEIIQTEYTQNSSGRLQEESPQRNDGLKIFAWKETVIGKSSHAAMLNLNGTAVTINGVASTEEAWNKEVKAVFTMVASSLNR